MEEIMNFVKPELLVLVPALYILGLMLKNAAAFKDEHIPAVLGAAGVVLVALWLAGTAGAANSQQWAMLVFTALVQGLLVAGLAVYANQVFKQSRKAEHVQVMEEKWGHIDMVQLADMSQADLKRLANDMGLHLPADADKVAYVTKIAEAQVKYR